ncbi:hypothetical protein [Caballeronia novacaledonica]|uniref:Uncharacterized protein n=1 Tax=Caballeronia novacaledonica TaxID=1544861 RepID=A0AA37IAC7_9BURK|nr:hypothetical protein [Caballeronia novacaledonica]GJH25549.1 hypothetical protein CBA19CS42_13555 [Caballeronia novacaledonica]
MASIDAAKINDATDASVVASLAGSRFPPGTLSFRTLDLCESLSSPSVLFIDVSSRVRGH